MVQDAAMRYIAFAGGRRLAAGDLRDVALAIKRHVDEGGDPVIVLEEATSRPTDLDLSGSMEELAGRLERSLRVGASAAATSPGPGRPKLGVVSREVSLLPRHWEWLAEQPGGASAILRRLVDEARRVGARGEQARKAQESAYRFMSVMAGDREGFEEATRALYRKEYGRVEALIEAWPADIRDHCRTLVAATAAAEQAAADGEE